MRRRCYSRRSPADRRGKCPLSGVSGPVSTGPESDRTGVQQHQGAPQEPDVAHAGHPMEIDAIRTGYRLLVRRRQLLSPSRLSATVRVKPLSCLLLPFRWHDVS